MVAARLYFPPGGNDILMIVKRTVYVDGERNNRLSYNFYINRNGEYYYANGNDFIKGRSRFGTVKDSEFDAFMNDEYFAWKYDKMLEGDYLNRIDMMNYLRTISTLDGTEETFQWNLSEYGKNPDNLRVVYEIKVRDNADDPFITIATFDNNGTNYFTTNVITNYNVQKIVKNLLQGWPIKIQNQNELDSIIQSLEG